MYPLGTGTSREIISLERSKPLPTWVDGLDLSFSRAPRDWWRRRGAEGFRVMAQCLWTGTVTPATARDNLRDSRLEGLVTSGYTVVNRLPGAQAVERARTAAGDEWQHLAALFIDVEVDGVTESAIREACEFARDLGKPVAIYSAHWFWAGRLGNPKWPWLLEYPVWNAYYDSNPDLDFSAASWGPWSPAHVIGEQYTGTTNIEGVDVDRDRFDLDFFARKEEHMGLTTEQEALLADTRNRLARLEGAIAGSELGGVFVRARGEPAVYLVRMLGTTRPRLIRNHVPNPPTWFALGGDNAREIAPEELARIPLGPPLPDLAAH